jgi:hypothetical protein
VSEAGPDRCPRCGGAFRCGVNGAAPCPCTTITLSAAQRADLRQRYSGCLCLRCLAELEREGSQPADHPVMRAASR